MNYTEVVEKLITKNFKTSEQFYKERDKQLEIAQKKVDQFNKKIQELEEAKYEIERTINQLRGL